MVVTSIPEAQAEPDVFVVTYDDEEQTHQTPLEVQAVAVEESPHAVSSSQFPITSTATSQNSARVAERGGAGFECMLCGHTRLRRIAGGCNFSFSICGDTMIDISDCHFAPGTKITLVMIRVCGNICMAVPPGTQVIVHRVSLCGTRDIHVEDPSEDDPQSTPPRLTIIVLSLCGGVRVRSNPNEMNRSFLRSFQSHT